MKLPKLRYWSTSEEINGLLFFAQIMDEMLFHFTIDTYKSPICNVHSLIDELENALNEAGKMNLEKNGNVIYTKPIREELLNKISEDLISKKILEKRYGKAGFNKILHNIDHWTNNEEYLIFIESLNSLFNEEYFRELKSHLHNSIKQCNFLEIQTLSQALIPELVFKGHSSQFIYYKIDSYFFKETPFDDVSKIDTHIDNFFAQFNNEEKKFEVVVRVSDEFQYLKEFIDYINTESDHAKSEAKIELLSAPPKPKATDDYYEKRFLNGKLDGLSQQYHFFLVFKNKMGIDPYQAIEATKFTLNILNSFSIYCTYYINLKWDDIYLVYYPNSTPFVTRKPVSPLAKNKKFAAFHELKGDFGRNLFELCRRQEDLMFKNFNDSTYKLYKSLGLHGSAINSKNIENQFLNSWICLEILLPSYQKEGLLERFKSTYLPLLNRKYLNKLIENFQRDLEFNTGQSIDNLLNDFPEWFNEYPPFEKCAALISVTDPSFDQIQAINKKIERNPLLRYRIIELHQKMFNGKSIKKTLDKHNQKLEWHLARLYRARNLLTHQGERIPNLDKLLENLNFYYHIILEEIEEISHSEPHLTSLDEAYKWATIENSAYLEFLKENNNIQVSNENFELFLFKKYTN